MNGDKAAGLEIKGRVHKNDDLFWDNNREASHSKHFNII